jgi:hypothetical protein
MDNKELLYEIEKVGIIGLQYYLHDKHKMKHQEETGVLDFSSEDELSDDEIQPIVLDDGHIGEHLYNKSDYMRSGIKFPTRKSLTIKHNMETPVDVIPLSEVISLTAKVNNLVKDSKVVIADVVDIVAEIQHLPQAKPLSILFKKLSHT